MNYRKIYEKHNNCSLLQGIEIHHIDGNHQNNDPSNLLAVTIQEHLDIHYKQKNWGAVQAILLRMDYNNKDISDAASKAQIDRLMKGTHNFQKMSKEKRTDISKKTLKERINEHGVAFLNINNTVENAKKAGKIAAEKKAGFLNTNSENHGSKHVKNTCWWTNIETGERVRAKNAPSEKWKRGMIK